VSDTISAFEEVLVRQLWERMVHPVLDRLRLQGRVDQDNPPDILIKRACDLLQRDCGPDATAYQFLTCLELAAEELEKEGAL
jgi:hypothetical protein